MQKKNLFFIAARDCIYLLETFARSIREKECFRDAWLIFCPERNLGHEGGYLTQPFMEIHPKNIAVAQYTHSDYGWWTDNQGKINYGYKTRELMAMGSIRFMKDWICTNPWLSPQERKKITRSKFEEQLKRFRPVTTPVKDPQSIPRMTVSGKVDKDGKVSGTFRDDIMMAFCMNIYIWYLIMMRQVANFNYQLVFAQ